MFSKRTLFFPLFILSSFLLNAQTTKQPKVVVGIVVDQMRYDYLYKFGKHYGEGGFKRLLNEGISCENAHFDYAPTYTGPGHASIYTGTTPAVHGIVGNDWYSREKGRQIYVTSDSKFKTVGTDSRRGEQAPTNLLSTTITDELKLNSNYRSKVVGVCIKDRGSVLPAGHLPDACLWFDYEQGRWVTSTYYASKLPNWVEKFNENLHKTRFFNQTWQRSSETAYEESFTDWEKYEGRLAGFEESNGQFPYALSPQEKDGKLNYSQVLYTPFGNEMTLDLALLAMDEMDMGEDEFTDFLCLSFSSTDYAGHLFGIHSEEVEDIYVRLDKSIEKLLKTLDDRYGKGNYLCFLTADHGGTETPEHLKTNGIPAGVVNENTIKEELEQVTSSIEENAILSVINQQVYLRHGLKHRAKVMERIIDHLNQKESVYAAFSQYQLMHLPDDFPFIGQLLKGIHPKRSGDIVFLLQPGWHDGHYHEKTGATHGSQYRYDTHVPLLWFGGNISNKKIFRRVGITDIAPTLAALLRIQEPNGCTGDVIVEVMK